MRWRRWTTWPTTLAPAVLARETSSPRGSRGSALDLGRMTPTRMARSCLTERWERVSDKGWFLREGYRHYMIEAEGKWEWRTEFLLVPVANSSRALAPREICDTIVAKRGIGV